MFAYTRAAEMPAPGTSPRRPAAQHGGGHVDGSVGLTRAGRLPRRLWLGTAFAIAATTEIHQHWICHMPASADVDQQPGQCPSMMSLHSYTELLCKAGLVPLLVKSVLRCCEGLGRRLRSMPADEVVPPGGTAAADAQLLHAFFRAAPAWVYLLWPGALWVYFGESGACGAACVSVEAIMEHACCFAILLASCAALWDFMETSFRGGCHGVCGCCANAALFRSDLEDHILPAHEAAHCARVETDAAGCSAAKVAALWAAYLSTAAVYVACTWFGWAGTPALSVLFRLLDTACHASLCALGFATLEHWLRSCGRGAEPPEASPAASPAGAEVGADTGARARLRVGARPHESPPAQPEAPPAMQESDEASCA